MDNKAREHARLHLTLKKIKEKGITVTEEELINYFKAHKNLDHRPQACLFLLKRSRVDEKKKHSLAYLKK